MKIDNGDNTAQIFSWDSLPEVLKQALPPNYTYVIQNFNSKPPYRTEENFEVPNFELDAFVDVDSEEKASEWVTTFQSHSKTTMPQTKAYDINGNWVIFRESRHCIHSHMVKKKQGKNVKVKRPKSSRARDINCMASIHIRLERRRLSLSHPLEINIVFMHNHIINCAEALSFQRVKEEVCEELLNYFKDGHSPSSALYAYQDELHLKATDEQELIELLADRSVNPDYDYTAKLFQKYRKGTLGSRNGKPMFERLAEIVQDYNSSGQGKAVLQEYDAYAGKVFILCIVTNLMCRVHEKILQAGELCYMDASASFEPLNSSITLIYTSCAVGALPLGLFITSDELEITLEKSINLLKTILPSYAFFGRGPQVGPIVFITDDSNAERNALELCWPKGIRLLCTFHVMQAFWRWVHDPKHHIKKEDRALIMEKMKRILYASSYSEMDTCYYEFKQMFYCLYPLLQKHFELLWNRRQFWALSFRVGLPMRGNNTNNYIERSFGMLKDVIFSRTQAYNPVQVFQFIINSMERFYERRLLGVAHKHPGSLRIAKRFLCPGWETVNSNAIQKTGMENEFLVPSTKNTGFYLVNSVLGTCSCPVGLTGAPCKHQGAVAMKFCIAIFNFIPSLKPDDRMIYSYIALGYVSQDSSFYASLRTEPAPQDQEFSSSSSSFNNNIDKIIEQREPSGKDEEIDISTFTAFLDDVKTDYQNGGKTLRTALDKFKDRYNTAKSKSIPRLSSFLYDINRSMDPMTRVKSGANIRVQVESIKRRKTEGGGVKRRLPIPTNEGKENLDPHAIPARKKRKTSKKEHNLSKNILKNRPN